MTKYPGSLHNHTQYSNLRLRDCIIKEKDLRLDAPITRAEVALVLNRLRAK